METKELGQDGPKKVRSCKPQHVDGHQNPATTDQEIADHLKKTFQGFNRVDKEPTPIFHPHGNHLINESETQRAPVALIPSKGVQPDGLIPKALKTLSPYIAPTLSRLPPNLTDS